MKPDKVVAPLTVGTEVAPLTLADGIKVLQELAGPDFDPEAHLRQKPMVEVWKTGDGMCIELTCLNKDGYKEELMLDLSTAQALELYEEIGELLKDLKSTE